MRRRNVAVMLPAAIFYNNHHRLAAMIFININ